ncbi:hypothetical protein N7468_007543 [Penicillium chermesinum]|uniref:Uncharacterized protein n=1 Tax=Penicillium chermesinum TaxID=63820 RepID=A0A9W9NUN2_9EURO|nr:uncharacterized protein N7468_007543 [Penicillium chermesinum]KAJ5226318.1 hypothetical protein N7468_007543 [Penicillium chermesinum]
MFRDESSSVMKKAKADAKASSSASSSVASRPKRSPTRSPRTASPDWGSASEGAFSVGSKESFDFSAAPQPTNTVTQPSNQSIQRQWQMPMEVQPGEPTTQEAVCFFLRSNTIPGTLWMSEFMTSFLLSPSSSPGQQAMQSGLTAVASAMFSRVKKINSLNHVARKEYAMALSALNKALVDVKEAKANQTLGAVVLLAIYEVSPCPDVSEPPPRGKTNATCGATALLDLRGPEQLQSEAGLRLFLHLRYQVIVSCFQRDQRVPDSLLDRTRFIMDLRPAEAHGHRLIVTIGKLSNLRADIFAGKFSDPQQIITAASAIEAELIAWLASLPPEFSYQTEEKSPYDFDFQYRCRGLTPLDKQYHVYPSLWVCNSWNQYRSARILVSEIILSHMRQVSDASSMRSLSEEFRLHCKTLRATIHRLAVDTCRSVPFYFGAHQVDSNAGVAVPPPESYIGGLMLLWPLFLSGIAESPNSPVRRWVVQCLSMIGNSMGLDQALALADLVNSDPGILRSTIDAEAEGTRITDEPSSAMSTSKHPLALRASEPEPGIVTGIVEDL